MNDTDDSSAQLREPLPPAPASPVVGSGLNAWRAAALLGMYVLAQIVIAMVVLLPLYVYYSGLLSGAQFDPAQAAKRLQTPALLLSIGALGILGAAVVVAFMTQWFFRGTPAREAYRVLGLSAAAPRNFWSAAALGVSLSVLYAIVAIKFVPPAPDQSFGPLRQAAMASGFPRVLWAILALLIAPPVEEFLFRGALYAGFANTWGRATSILLVTVTFVLLHLFETHFYWPAIVSITCMALALIAVRIRSGSLGPPMLLHAGYNLGLVVIAFSSIGS